MNGKRTGCGAALPAYARATAARASARLAEAPQERRRQGCRPAIEAALKCCPTLFFCVVFAATCFAQKTAKPSSDNYDELYAKYLNEARQPVTQPGVAGWAWMTDLALDHRARRLNDIVTIRVLE